LRDRELLLDVLAPHRTVQDEAPVDVIEATRYGLPGLLAR
jgi:hypothetical protein